MIHLISDSLKTNKISRNQTFLADNITMGYQYQLIWFIGLLPLPGTPAATLLCSSAVFGTRRHGWVARGGNFLLASMFGCSLWAGAAMGARSGCLPIPWCSHRASWHEISQRNEILLRRFHVSFVHLSAKLFRTGLLPSLFAILVLASLLC